MPKVQNQCPKKILYCKLVPISENSFNYLGTGIFENTIYVKKLNQQSLRVIFLKKFMNQVDNIKHYRKDRDRPGGASNDTALQETASGRETTVTACSNQQLAVIISNDACSDASTQSCLPLIQGNEANLLLKPISLNFASTASDKQILLCSSNALMTVISKDASCQTDNNASNVSSAGSNVLKLSVTPISSEQSVVHNPLMKEPNNQFLELRVPSDGASNSGLSPCVGTTPFAFVHQMTPLLLRQLYPHNSGYMPGIVCFQSGNHPIQSGNQVVSVELDQISHPIIQTDALPLTSNSSGNFSLTGESCAQTKQEGSDSLNLSVLSSIELKQPFKGAKNDIQSSTSELNPCADNNQNKKVESSVKTSETHKLKFTASSGVQVITTSGPVLFSGALPFGESMVVASSSTKTSSSLSSNSGSNYLMMTESSFSSQNPEFSTLVKCVTSKSSDQLNPFSQANPLSYVRGDHCLLDDAKHLVTSQEAVISSSILCDSITTTDSGTCGKINLGTSFPNPSDAIGTGSSASPTTNLNNMSMAIPTKKYLVSSTEPLFCTSDAMTSNANLIPKVEAVMAARSLPATTERSCSTGSLASREGSVTAGPSSVVKPVPVASKKPFFPTVGHLIIPSSDIQDVTSLNFPKSMSYLNDLKHQTETVRRTNISQKRHCMPASSSNMCVPHDSTTHQVSENLTSHFYDKTVCPVSINSTCVSQPNFVSAKNGSTAVNHSPDSKMLVEEAPNSVPLTSTTVRSDNHNSSTLNAPIELVDNKNKTSSTFEEKSGTCLSSKSSELEISPPLVNLPEVKSNNISMSNENFQSLNSSEFNETGFDSKFDKSQESSPQLKISAIDSSAVLVEYKEDKSFCKNKDFSSDLSSESVCESGLNKNNVSQETLVPFSNLSLRTYSRNLKRTSFKTKFKSVFTGCEIKKPSSEVNGSLLDCNLHNDKNLIKINFNSLSFVGYSFKSYLEWFKISRFNHYSDFEDFTRLSKIFSNEMISDEFCKSEQNLGKLEENIKRISSANYNKSSDNYGFSFPGTSYLQPVKEESKSLSDSIDIANNKRSSSLYSSTVPQVKFDQPMNLPDFPYPTCTEAMLTKTNTHTFTAVQNQTGTIKLKSVLKKVNSPKGKFKNKRVRFDIPFHESYPVKLNCTKIKSVDSCLKSGNPVLPLRKFNDAQLIVNSDHNRIASLNPNQLVLSNNSPQTTNVNLKFQNVVDAVAVTPENILSGTRDMSILVKSNSKLLDPVIENKLTLKVEGSAVECSTLGDSLEKTNPIHKVNQLCEVPSFSGFNKPFPIIPVASGKRRGRRKGTSFEQPLFICHYCSAKRKSRKSLIKHLNSIHYKEFRFRKKRKSKKVEKPIKRKRGRPPLNKCQKTDKIKVVVNKTEGKYQKKGLEKSQIRNRYHSQCSDIIEPITKTTKDGAEKTLGLQPNQTDQQAIKSRKRKSVDIALDVDGQVSLSEVVVKKATKRGRGRVSGKLTTKPKSDNGSDIYPNSDDAHLVKSNNDCPELCGRVESSDNLTRKRKVVRKKTSRVDCAPVTGCSEACLTTLGDHKEIVRPPIRSQYQGKRKQTKPYNWQVESIVSNLCQNIIGKEPSDTVAVKQNNVKICFRSKSSDFESKMPEIRPSETGEASIKVKCLRCVNNLTDYTEGQLRAHTLSKHGICNKLLCSICYLAFSDLTDHVLKVHSYSSTLDIEKNKLFSNSC